MAGSGALHRQPGPASDPGRSGLFERDDSPPAPAVATPAQQPRECQQQQQRRRLIRRRGCERRSRSAGNAALRDSLWGHGAISRNQDTELHPLRAEIGARLVCLSVCLSVCFVSRSNTMPFRISFIKEKKKKVYRSFAVELVRHSFAMDRSDFDLIRSDLISLPLGRHPIPHSLSLSLRLSFHSYTMYDTGSSVHGRGKKEKKRKKGHDDSHPALG